MKWSVWSRAIVLIWPSVGNWSWIQACKEIMARNSLLPHRAAGRKAVGFQLSLASGSALLTSAWAVLSWAAFGGPNGHKISSFPTDLTCALPAGQTPLWQSRLFWMRQSHQHCRGRCLPSCPSALHTFQATDLWHLARASQDGFTAYSSSNQQVEGSRCSGTSRFACTWQRMCLYLLRKKICLAKPPPGLKSTCLASATWLPRVAMPLSPSSSRPWQPCSLSREPDF